MRPAFSVVFLTTLIGAGQGLFLALFAGDAGARLGGVDAPIDFRFFVAGAAVSLALSALGLVASFLHLGRPERAWRSAAMWRTSWLSREVIALPLFMASVTAWGAAHYAGSGLAMALGLVALAACLALFACTGMVYACIKFLQEWASPLTLMNFALIGTASGFTLAVPIAATLAPALARPYALAAITLTLAALATRAAALARNGRLRPKSTLQSAIGAKSGRVAQISQGFTAGSFNTTEFFHGVSPQRMRAVRAGFLQFGFVLPVVMLAAGLMTGYVGVFAAAFAVQFAGLIAERWYFLAQATHPQNLYYRCAA
jgi:DMSO reductase anchor subunit